MSDPTAPLTRQPRKGPRPSAETIRKRVALMIGSGNVERLDKEGYVVVPASLFADLSILASYVTHVEPTNGDAGA